MAEPPRLRLAEKFEARASRAFLRPLMGLAALAGAIAALAHAPFYLWPLGPLGLAGLFALLRATRGAPHGSATPGAGRRAGWRAFWLGWAGGAGYFATALFWIVEPFFVDLARHGWMAPFALLFLAGGLALFWGAGFALARWLGGGALAWIAALTGAEMLRSYLFTGFPWALIGYVWAASPADQFAAFIGPHGLSAAALACGALIWRLTTARWPQIALALALLAGLIGLGAWLGRPVAPAPDAPVARLIQPNAPQHQKWDPDHVLTFYERQLGYTAAPPQGARAPDLIVWPETAIPWLLENAGPALQRIAAEAGTAQVLLGLRRIEAGRLYNALVRLDGAGQVMAIYDKHHLVPFGEYVPFGDLAAQVGIKGLAQRDGNGYSPGPGARLLDIPGIGPALPLICYEAVFPQDVRAAPARPRLLLQITNDAWFGQFSGPFQHLQQARMRAIEQGLPMLRVANTGVSAMIGPRGALRAEIALGTAGFADAALPPALAPTLYARSGDWPALIAVLALLGAGAARRRFGARG